MPVLPRPAICMYLGLRTSAAHCAHVRRLNVSKKIYKIALASREEPRMTLSAQMVKIAQIVELGGAAAVVAGVILSVHHYAIGACFVAGIAALGVGYKLRQS